VFPYCNAAVAWLCKLLIREIALSDRWKQISVDNKDIFVLSLTEVYPPDISTGSSTTSPEPASIVRSFTRARIQVSFSLDAYL
jgi:hypothetical protein